jgi:hypothetical protein
MSDDVVGLAGSSTSCRLKKSAEGEENWSEEELEQYSWPLAQGIKGHVH